LGLEKIEKCGGGRYGAAVLREGRGTPARKEKTRQIAIEILTGIYLGY